MISVTLQNWRLLTSSMAIPAGFVRHSINLVVLPDGRELLTLREAAEYITALPKAEHDAADWQVAMETLLLIAERDGPEMWRGSRS